MPKNKTKYVCQNCGHTEAKWLGKCPACGQWDTLVEEMPVPEKLQKAYLPESATKSVPKPLTKVVEQETERLATGIREFDRVLGGGLTLKYMAKAGLNKIGPFAGIRYMHIKGREYTDSLGVNREADKINSMVVPVGLEYTAEFKMPKSEWTWKPMLMAGYLFNLGDRTNDMFLRYNDAMDTFAYDFVDKGAFFAKAGMAFEKKNFSLGISYDFMKSKNSKNRRWNVNADVAF